MDGVQSSPPVSGDSSTDLSYHIESITLSDEEGNGSQEKSRESLPTKPCHSIQPLTTNPDMPALSALRDDSSTNISTTGLSESPDESDIKDDAEARLKRILVEGNVDDDKNAPYVMGDASSTQSAKSFPEQAPFSIYNTNGEVKMRDYQKEISRNILEGRNDIIVLPTGTGKTRVALNLMIAKHLKPNSESCPRKKILYTAPNRVLARQQYRRIADALEPDYDTKLLTGGMAADESESGPEALLRIKNCIEGEEHDVLILTPQLVVNYFSGFPSAATLAHFSLIIVDECHTASEMTQPSFRLLKCYHRELIKDESRHSELPQLVGLTATPVPGSPSRIENAIDSIVTLCGMFDMDRAPTEVIKYKDELKRYTANPKSDIEDAVTRPGHIEFVKRIEKNMTSIRDYILKELDVDPVKFPLLKDAKVESKKIKPSADYIITAGTLSRAMEKIEKQFDYSSKVQDMNCVKAIKHMRKYANARNLALRCAYQQVITELEREMRDLRFGGKELQGIPLYNQFLDEWLPELDKVAVKDDGERVHDNLKKLKKKIEESFEKNKDTKMMIFTDRRDVCRLLADWINDFKDERYRAHRLVSSSEGKGDENMPQSEQKKAMEGFTDGTYNILVSTSIGELGLDIPECNTVISYLYAKDFGSTKQLAGRCRVLDGSVHWIIDTKQKAMLAESKRVEELLEKALATVRTDGFDRYIFTQKKEQIVEQIRKEKEIEEQMAAVQGSTKILCRQCGMAITDTSKVKCYMDEQYIPFDKTLETKIYVIEGGAGSEFFLNGTTAIGRLYCSNRDEKCNNHLGKAFTINQTSRHLALFKLEKVRFEGSDVNRTGKHSKGTWKALRSKYYIEVIDYERFMSLIKTEGFTMEVRKPEPGQLESLLMESMSIRNDERVNSSEPQT